MGPRRIIIIAGTIWLGLALAPRVAAPAESAGEARVAMAEMHQWIQQGGQLDGWRAYLLSDALEAQLARGAGADKAIVQGALGRYASGAAGLDAPPIVKTRKALERWLEELSIPPWDQIPAACRKGKADFKPLGPADLEKVKAELMEAVARLDRQLAADAASNAAGWKAYLEWPTFLDELRKPRPDLTKLDVVYLRFAGGHPGLELAWFAEVRQTLRRYLFTARAAGNPALKTQYGALLDRLATQLETYQRAPTAELAIEIGLSLGWLSDARQTPELRKAVKRYFAQPNLYGVVSAGLMSVGVEASVDETTPIQDVILNTSVQGTDRTRGRVTLELVPSPTTGEMEVVFRGLTNTDSVGFSNGATVRSTSITQVEARKRLRADGRHLTPLPARVGATVQTTLQSVDPGRGGGRAQQEAWRRAQAETPQADQVASEHARQRASERMDREIGQQAASINQWLDRWCGGAESRGVFPQVVQASTTAEAIFFTAIEAGANQLAAAELPPALAGKLDFGVQIHESTINNACSEALAGMISHEDRTRDWLTSVLGPLPQRFQRDPQAEPWIIHLARQAPVSVRFRDGTIAVTVRGDRYIAEGNQFPGLDMTLAYKIVNDNGRFKAVRQGNLQIFPRGFVPGSGQQLSARQQVLRNMIERRLGKMLDAEMVPDDLVLAEPWNKAGPLHLVQWQADGGWLVMAWNRR